MEQLDNEHKTFEFFTPTKDLEDPVVAMTDPFDAFLQKHDVEPSSCPPKKKRLQMKVRYQIMSICMTIRIIVT